MVKSWDIAVGVWKCGARWKMDVEDNEYFIPLFILRRSCALATTLLCPRSLELYPHFKVNMLYQATERSD
jgi:hypothetical protein